MPDNTDRKRATAIVASCGISNDGDVAILLGYTNRNGKWRTLRGQWYSKDAITMDWEDSDDGEEGWYETSVQADDPPNVWPVTPTHWRPLPVPPVANDREKK